MVRENAVTIDITAGNSLGAVVLPLRNGQGGIN